MSVSPTHWHILHPHARTGVYATYQDEYRAKQDCETANDVSDFLLSLSEFTVSSCASRQCWYGQGKMVPCEFVMTDGNVCSQRTTYTGPGSQCDTHD